MESIFDIYFSSESKFYAPLFFQRQLGFAPTFPKTSFGLEMFRCFAGKWVSSSSIPATNNNSWIQFSKTTLFCSTFSKNLFYGPWTADTVFTFESLVFYKTLCRYLYFFKVFGTLCTAHFWVTREFSGKYFGISKISI